MSEELDLAQLRKVAEAEETQKWGGWAFEEDDWDGYCVYINNGGFGRSYVAEKMIQGESDGKSTAEHIATFDPPTVLALIDRVEAAEQAVARVREVAETCTDKFLTMALFEALDGDQA